MSIETLPYPLRQIAEEDAFRKQYGGLQKRYPLATFDKDAAMRVSQAEFISFGHPLFEAILTRVERSLTATLAQGAAFTDPDGRMDGMLLFYQGEILDGRGQVAGTRLFALFADRFSGQILAANPAILWDLQEGGLTPELSSDQSGQHAEIESIKRQSFGVLLPEMEKYRQSLAVERQRQAAIKEKYGLRSLEHLVLKLDGDLINLYDRRERGDNVDLVIRNKQEQKARYEHALMDLQTALTHERNLTLSTPRFLGQARMVCLPGSDEMSSDANVEQIGMEVAMQHERSQGWMPEDVAKQNLGFDVRSIAPDGRRRYIEVKARAVVGPVGLTQNEWFKARRFQDEYYLYAVLNAATIPELYRIQNPFNILHPDEQVEVRYIVSVSDIKSMGERT